jgi:colanic acid biosynthesis glycosyl transferase WcaI
VVPQASRPSPMKVLLLSQVFHPDVVAVAQYVTDLGASLAAGGHDVTAVCSSRRYDDPAIESPRKETWNGIRICRVKVWGLGKQSKLRRIVGFASFFLSSLVALAMMPGQDVVVVVPPPPLLSVLGAVFVACKGGRLVFWSMDLNPDEAIAAGWMKRNSIPARLLEMALRFSLRASASIVVLDRYMKARIVAKGVPEHKVHIVPLWSLDEKVFFDPAGRAAFRRELGVDGQLVVMYSGNHCPLHPLDTLLEAALWLCKNPAVAFVFVGGGSEFTRVNIFARDHGLDNIHCVPYQPLEKLSASLSAADLQVVLLGDEFVGIVHPSKIYNMLAVGAPFLYIGPRESHITDMQQFPQIASMGRFVRHGDVDEVVARISELAWKFADTTYTRPGRPAALDCFARQTLMSSMTALIEDTVHPLPAAHQLVSER